jgi:hypothetical protein
MEVKILLLLLYYFVVLKVSWAVLNVLLAKLYTSGLNLFSLRYDAAKRLNVFSLFLERIVDDFNATFHDPR